MLDRWPLEQLVRGSHTHELLSRARSVGVTLCGTATEGSLNGNAGERRAEREGLKRRADIASHRDCLRAEREEREHRPHPHTSSGTLSRESFRKKKASAVTSSHPSFGLYVLWLSFFRTEKKKTRLLPHM